MARRAFYIFTVIVLRLALHASGQDFPMLHYTVRDGLPSNTVYSVCKDSKGFMWIATDKGIARYNGIKFETFTTANGLPDNEVFFFKEDYEGRLWLATYSGALCYWQNDTFHTAANTPLLNLPLKASFIRDIHMEHDSSITFIFFSGYKFLNIKKQVAKIIDLSRVEDKIFMRGVFYIQKYARDGFKIWYNSSFLFIDSNYHIYKRLSFDDGRRKNYNNSIKITCFQDNVYEYNHYFLFDSNACIIKILDTNITHKYFINKIYKNQLDWFICTDHGLFINDTVNILASSNVSFLGRDIDKSYWITTLDNGIFVLDENFMQSRIYQHSYLGKVLYTTSFKKNVFFVASDSINRIYRLNNSHVKDVYNYKTSNNNNNKFTSAFLIDSNYHFCSVDNSGIVTIKSLLAKPKAVKKYPWDISNSYVMKSILQIDSLLYINSKFCILSINTNKIGAENALRYRSDTMANERVFDMAKSPNNDIWYSNIKSVFKITNGIGVAQTQFKNISFKSFIFLQNHLIGYTHTNQLLVCNDVNGNIAIDSVLHQNCVWENFYILDSAHLLISTNNQYRLITLSENGDNSYSIRPVENPYIPQSPEAMSSDGENCYFFKDGAITSINIKSILWKPQPPILFFTTWAAGNRIFPVQSEVQIPYEASKSLDIRFSILSLGSKDISTQFAIVSAGDSDNWKSTAGDVISLYNLGYGHFTVKLRAKTISSGYGKPIVFSLIILRPFWATWWFIVLVTAAFLSAMALITKVRIAQAMRKNKKEHEAQVKFMRSEYKALNALMNPHFIFNTLNNVQSLVNGNDKLAANEYLRVFADIIRQNMHNVSKELIPLQKEIDLVRNYLALEQLRFRSKLAYSIHIDENIDTTEIMVPPLLIQPLVENSIKHGILPRKGTKGTISINIYERQHILHIEVKDDGQGISNSKRDAGHESFGLENIRQRLQQLSIIQGKDISLTIKEMEGTIVIITMPLEY